MSVMLDRPRSRCFRHLPATLPAMVLPVAASFLLGIGDGLGGPARAAAAQPTVEYALGLSPVQKGINIAQVPAVDVPKVSLKMEKEGGVTAWVVRGSGGEKLRSFADTNGDRVVDRWSYFRDGVEVYRDIDSNHNAKPDQSRWLASDGLRWGVDENEDGVIDRWKSISAEEATAEVVESLKRRDAARFSRLLPTAKDLELAGFAGEKLEEMNRRVDKAQAGFAKMIAEGKPLDESVTWNSMLASGPPGALVADDAGVTRDVAAYDTVMALVDAGGKGSQIYIGSLVRCGDAWRPLDAPQVPGSRGEIADAGGFFFSRPISGDGPSPVDGEASDRIRPILVKLRELEDRLASAADAKSRAAIIADQIGLLEEVVQAAEADERAFWVKQLAETLSAAVQEDAVADGIARLEKLASAVEADEPLHAFVLFRLASARYAWSMQQPGADVGKVQAAWLEELRQFVEKHPKTADAAEALLQMGISEEFSGREKEALDRYAVIVREFPDSAAGRKAKGAVRRLESMGRPLSIVGTSTDGKTVSVESLRGVPVLVHYWATWSEPCKVDIARIRELVEKYGSKKLAVVAISLDTDKKRLAAFLAAKPMPWPCLHEPGGIDGRLAEELGVLKVPTMILLDSQGNVVDRNVSVADLEQKIEAVLAGK